MLTKIRYKLVFNRSGRTNKRGEGLIEIECSQMNRRIYFSTHTYVMPGQFSSGRIINSDIADDLNYVLFKMIQDVEKGVQLTTIQKLLGHQKLQTTQIYSEVDRKAIANDLKRKNKK